MADLAIVEAWHRYEPRDGGDFERFARAWVLGEIRRTLARAGEDADARREGVGLPPPASPVDPHHCCLARELVAALTREQATFLLAHVFEVVSLATLARAAGRHRSWATRRSQVLVAELRARGLGTTAPGTPSR